MKAYSSCSKMLGSWGESSGCAGVDPGNFQCQGRLSQAPERQIPHTLVHCHHNITVRGVQAACEHPKVCARPAVMATASFLRPEEEKLFEGQPKVDLVRTDRKYFL